MFKINLQTNPLIKNFFKLIFNLRCGALSVGDQILSVDETVVENTAFSPDDVTSLLDSNSGRGYTQIQILPGYAMQRRRGKHFFCFFKYISIDHLR